MTNAINETGAQSMTNMMMAVSEGGPITMELMTDEDNSEKRIIRVDMEDSDKYYDLGIETAKRLADVLTDDDQWGPADKFVMTLKLLVAMAEYGE